MRSAPPPAARPAASDDPASAAISTRLSRITASPRVAQLARPGRPRPAARSSRPAASAAACVAGRAHAALLDEAAHPAGGLASRGRPTRCDGTRPATTSCCVAVAQRRRRSGPGPAPPARGRRDRSAVSRKAATTPSSTPRAGQPRRQPQQGEVERRVDVEARPALRRQVTRVRSRPPPGSGPRRCRSRSSARAFERAIHVAGDDERIGAEAVVGDHLARARRGQGRQAARRRAAPARRRRHSRWPRRGLPAVRASGGRRAPPRRTSDPSGRLAASARAAAGAATSVPAAVKRRDSSAASRRLAARPRRAAYDASPGDRGRRLHHQDQTARDARSEASAMALAPIEPSPSSRWSCSRCIRSCTPAKRSHSPQRRWPTSGWSSGHGSASWPAIAAAEVAIERRVLSRQVCSSVSTAGVGRTRNAGADHRRVVGRPLAARRQRAGVGQPAPRGGGVGEGLRHVPVLLAAGRAQLLLGHGRQARPRASATASCWARMPRRGARPGSAADLAAEGAAADCVAPPSRRRPRPGRACSRACQPARAARHRSRGARSARPGGRRPWRRRPRPRPGTACRTRPAP